MIRERAGREGGREEESEKGEKQKKEDRRKKGSQSCSSTIPDVNTSTMEILSYQYFNHLLTKP